MDRFYKDFIENVYLLLDGFGHPTFVFDSEGKIIRVNSTLERILKKSHIRMTNTNIEGLLKLNGINANLKKFQFCKRKISLYKYKDKKLIHFSLLTKNNEYNGGVIIIMDKKFQHFFMNWYEILDLKYIDSLAKKLSLIGGGTIHLKELLDDIEKITIIQILKKTNNKSEAIKSLGVSRRTFYYKLKKYKLL